MARQSRRSAPAARPRAPPQKSAAPVAQPQQTQPALAQQAQPKQPGLFAQMASTAAGVAVGSAVGHTIGAGLTGMFSGGSSAPEAPQTVSPPAQPLQQNMCEPDQKALLKCLEANKSDINVCQFYMDMLNQCQASSKQF
ncbi:hypothetical protein HK098_000180 [Nowakowskiella sp. JEL0407]|nr:hypothetical protein HK098_000180 [Nowakowskiella sp. JEL0407]